MSRGPLRLVARWEALLVVLIVAAGVWCWSLSSFFLSRANLLDLLSPYVFVGLLAIGLVIATALGAVNGVLVGLLELPSLAVTLGTLAAFRGLAYVILGGEGA